jgi:hypothetical protein
MLDDNEFEILVSSFNSKLRKLLKELDYCQHDSEYRVFYDDSLDVEKKALIADLNKILYDCPDFASRVYIYSANYYELTEYRKGENRYAARSFSCVSKKNFENFCISHNISTKDYFIEKEDNVVKPKNFESNMNTLIDPYNFELPTYISIYCPKNCDGFHHNYDSICNILSNFKFVNTLRLRDDCKIMRLMKN